MAKEDDDALVDIYGDASDTMDPPPIITAKDKLNAPVRREVGASILSPDTPLEVDYSMLSPENEDKPVLAAAPPPPAEKEEKEELDLHVSSSMLQDATLAIYLANLTWWTSDAMLESLCAMHDLKRGLTDLLFLDQRSNGKSKGLAYLQFQSNEQSAKAKRLFEQTEKLPQRPTVSFVPLHEIGDPFRQDDDPHASRHHSNYSSSHASRSTASAHLSSSQYRPRGGGGYHARPSSAANRPSSSSSYSSRSHGAEGQRGSTYGSSSGSGYKREYHNDAQQHSFGARQVRPRYNQNY